MSYMMLHAMGDCAPENHCGCLSDTYTLAQHHRDHWQGNRPEDHDDAGNGPCAWCDCPTYREDHLP